MARDINLEVTDTTQIILENVFIAEEYEDKYAPGVYVPEGHDPRKTRVLPNDAGTIKVQLYKSNACVTLNPEDTLTISPKDSTELYYYLSKDNVDDGGFLKVTVA